MRPFFADTFYWIALTNPRDRAHRQVIECTAKLQPRSVLTTDEVLTEFLTYCAFHRQLRQEAGLATQSLLSDPDIQTLYTTRPDKRYSLTDCISMQTMRREGITDVLTNDHHFEQEGFRVLFRQA